MTVAFDSAARCAGCSTGGGCGAGLLAVLFSPRNTQIDIPRQPGFTCQDSVELSLSSSMVLKMALIGYCLPILGMLICAMICQYFVSSQAPHIALSGIVGLIAGLMAYPVLSAYVSGRSDCVSSVAAIES